MGLSIGWPSRTETLCVLWLVLAVCVCLCVCEACKKHSCISVYVWEDKWKEAWCEFEKVCFCTILPCLQVLQVKSWGDEALNYLTSWVSAVVWHELLMRFFFESNFLELFSHMEAISAINIRMSKLPNEVIQI